jgi:hypothetical protein
MAGQFTFPGVSNLIDISPSIILRLAFGQPRLLEYFRTKENLWGCNDDRTTVATADSQITFFARKATVRAMNRGALLQRLAQARRHIAIGEDNIVRLHDIIGGLERGGRDSSVARELLARFEKLQKLHVNDCGRLENQLAKFPK